jgi:hypothetical protein
LLRINLKKVLNLSNSLQSLIALKIIELEKYWNNLVQTKCISLVFINLFKYNLNYRPFVMDHLLRYLRRVFEVDQNNLFNPRPGRAKGSYFLFILSSECWGEVKKKKRKYLNTSEVSRCLFNTLLCNPITRRASRLVFTGLIGY